MLSNGDVSLFAALAVFVITFVKLGSKAIKHGHIYSIYTKLLEVLKLKTAIIIQYHAI